MIETKIRDLFADIAAAPVDALPETVVLRRVRRRRIRNGGGAVLLGLAVVVGGVAVPRMFNDRATSPITGSDEAPSMKSVPPEVLAEMCCPMGLLAPSTNDPPISKSRAEQIVLDRKQFPPGTVVLESVLARTPKNPNAWLSAGVPVEDFWIVSMWPPDGPDAPSYTYGLVFIDARTGTWLSTAWGGPPR